MNDSNSEHTWQSWLAFNASVRLKYEMQLEFYGEQISAFCRYMALFKTLSFVKSLLGAMRRPWPETRPIKRIVN